MQINTLRLRQNGHNFADNIFKLIFLNEYVWIPIIISLNFVPHGPINNIPALVQIMAWRRPGNKPLSGPMMVILPTHICVTRPQWVNQLWCALYTNYHMVLSGWKKKVLSRRLKSCRHISLFWYLWLSFNTVSTLNHLPWMFPPMDILFEQWIG